MAENHPYTQYFTNEVWDNEVLKENKELTKDFINYCKSVDRSLETIKQYESTLKWLFCYMVKEFNNKSFIKISKRDVMNLQNHWLNECGLSSSRIRFIKSTMSSLSNFIENILDDEYPDFRNIINKIPAPTKSLRMVKTVLSKEDIDNLLNKLVEQGLVFHAFYVAILAFSGVRKAESLNLSLDMFNDNNVLNGKLWVTPEIRTKGKGRDGKKLNKYVIIEKFKPYLELYLKERELLNVDIPDMLVTKRDGKWVKAEITTLNSWVETIERVLGDRFYSHSLRHSYVTQLLESGVPIDVVKDLVGHESSETTSLYDDRTKENKFTEHLSKI